MKISEERHPDLDQIKHFLRGEASPAETRELVRHLLHGCLECQKVVREHWPGSFAEDLSSVTGRSTPKDQPSAPDSGWF